DASVEDGLQLLEPHDERVVETRVLVERRGDEYRIALAGCFEQVAKSPVERNPDLVRHAEGEDLDLRIVESLGVQQGSRTERLNNIGTRRTQMLEQLAISARNARGRREHPFLERRIVERVQKQLELARVPLNPRVERQGVLR